MMKDLHFPSVVKAVILSLLIASFSFLIGTNIFIPYFEKEEPNVLAPSAIITQALEENSPLLVYLHVVSYTIYPNEASNGTDVVYGSRPLLFGIDQFNLGKDIPLNNTNEDIKPNDVRFETNEWFLYPSPCCDSVIEKKYLSNIEAKISILESSLISDFDNMISLSNVTGNDTIERNLPLNNLGNEHWEIFHLYKDGSAILIHGYGQEVIVSFGTFDFVWVSTNEYVITSDYSTQYYGQFDTEIFSNYKLSLIDFLEYIFSE